MLRASAFIVCLAFAVAAPLSELNGEWELFKTQHAKQYVAHEEPLRRLIWEDNIKFIQRHNLEADRGVHTYWLGINEYADRSVEEIIHQMNGYQMRPANSSSNPLYLPPSHVSIPDEVDWRKEGYVTPVKNQEQCGSCWAFSTTGSLEGQHFKKTNTLVSLSEQNLVDCSKAEGNHGCKGGLMDNAFRYIKENKGIDTEESYPYKGRDGICHFSRQNVGATDTGFVDIKRESESDLKNAVGTVGPISVAMDASKRTFHFYKSGIYSDPTCSSIRLDHGVLAVGYGTDNGRDYWLVKNSWGTTWGMEGYFKIARNSHNMCGLATAASYPTV